MRSVRSYGGATGPVQTLARHLAGLMVALLVAGLILPGPAASAAVKPVKIVVLGDSLTAGYGLPAEAAFPSRLAAALKAKGHEVEIVNAGVSGDTASGGRDRLEWSVPQDADAVIVELGANDALRGLDPQVTRAALDVILKKLTERGVAVLLCGMQAPRNLGADYAQAYDAIFPALAQAHDVAFYPFFLDGVATETALNQSDGMHPNEAGVGVIVQRILPAVEALIAQVKQRRRS